MTELNTEKEVPNVEAHPAGGNDPHRDAERAKQEAEASEEADENRANTSEGVESESSSDNDDAEAEAKAKMEAEVKAQEELNSGAEKSEYKVLKGVEFPRGTVYSEGATIELTEAAASSFAGGLIEKVDTTDAVDTAPEQDETPEPTVESTPETETPVAPTKEEQKAIDELVDFTVTAETLEVLNKNLPDGAPVLTVGDVVKLSKEHDLLKTVEMPQA